MNVRSFFVSFEGIEGAGKTTHVAAAKDFFLRSGRVPVVFREPGGTDIGDRIRELLLAPCQGSLCPMAEFFLFCASRSQLVEARIRPALARGCAVICDRFSDSSVAYQAFGRGLPLEVVREVNRIATGDLKPDLTILLDLPVEEGLRRVRARRGRGETDDRFEAEELEFHHRVREGFLALASEEQERIKVVSASQSPVAVAATVRKLIEHEFSGHSRS